jgi:predicted nucleic acid-binding protein
MGLTLDTGAVIAIEDAKRRRTSERHVGLLRALAEDGAVVTVPAVVLAEWWRGHPGQPWRDIAEDSGYEVEIFDRAMSKEVGRLLQKLTDHDRGDRERLLLVDASVVIGAARRSDDIYTVDSSDIAKLVALHGYDEKRVKYL